MDGKDNMCVIWNHFMNLLEDFYRLYETYVDTF